MQIELENDGLSRRSANSDDGDTVHDALEATNVLKPRQAAITDFFHRIPN